MSEPTITFTYAGATITVVETPPSTTLMLITSTPARSSSSKSTKATTTSYGSSMSSTSSVSCSQALSTISDLSAGQALANSCPTFSGSIIIPSDVSTPIDLTGLEELTGSFVCEGFNRGGLTKLSSNSLSSVGGDLSIENADTVVNVSFPKLLSVGGLSVVGNSALRRFDGMPALISINGPALLNGSFSSVSFPNLTTVSGYFDVSSTKNLDCGTVAPKYHPTNSLLFECTSANGTMTVGSNGTMAHTDSGLSGLTLKYKLIIGLIVGIAFLVIAVGIFLYYTHRQLLRQTLDLVKESKFKVLNPRRTPKTPASTFNSQKSPAPSKKDRILSNAQPSTTPTFEVFRRGVPDPGMRVQPPPSNAPPIVSELEPAEQPRVWPQGPPPPSNGSSSKRTGKTREDEMASFSPISMAPVPVSISVHEQDMVLLNELQALNDKAKPPGRLTAPESIRRDWIRSQLPILARPSV